MGRVQRVDRPIKRGAARGTPCIRQSHDQGKVHVAADLAQEKPFRQTGRKWFDAQCGRGFRRKRLRSGERDEPQNRPHPHPHRSLWPSRPEPRPGSAQSKSPPGTETPPPHRRSPLRNPRLRHARKSHLSREAPDQLAQPRSAPDCSPLALRREAVPFNMLRAGRACRHCTQTRQAQHRKALA